MPQEFTYTFTDEERQGLILRLDLLVKYLNQDLTFADDKRKVLIETTKDLRKRIEYGSEQFLIFISVEGIMSLGWF